MPVLFHLLRWIGHNPWLRKGLRYRIIAPIYRQFPPRVKSFSTEVYGYAYTGNLDNFIDWNVYFFGSYEFEDLRLLAKLGEMRKAREHGRLIFYDIGANIGYHTLFAARYYDRVYAFEPYPAVRNQLMDKIHLNHLEHVFVFPVGLSHTNETGTYNVPGDANLGSGYFTSAAMASNAGASTMSLELVQGDEFVQTNKLDLPDVIKLDVEGYEPFCLAGLFKTIEAARPVILVEMSEESLQNLKIHWHTDNLLSLLPPGYRAYCSRHNRLRETEPRFIGENFFFIPEENAFT